MFKAKKLKERVKLTLDQSDYKKTDYFRIRQRDQLELNQIISRYKNKQEKEDKKYKRLWAAHQAKLSITSLLSPQSVKRKLQQDEPTNECRSCGLADHKSERNRLCPNNPVIKN